MTPPNMTSTISVGQKRDESGFVKAVFTLIVQRTGQTTARVNKVPLEGLKTPVRALSYECRGKERLKNTVFEYGP